MLIESLISIFSWLGRAAPLAGAAWRRGEPASRGPALAARGPVRSRQNVFRTATVWYAHLQDGSGIVVLVSFVCACS